MSTIESVVWVVAGLALVAGMVDVLYFQLPESMRDSAARHGRYAGLGRRPGRSDSAPGTGVGIGVSWIGARA